MAKGLSSSQLYTWTRSCVLLRNRHHGGLNHNLGRFYAKEAHDALHNEREIRRKEMYVMNREEIERGYFGDVREYNRLHGKLFQAATDVIPPSQAEIFPHVSASTLTGRTVNLRDELSGKTTLLCVGARDFAMPQLKSFSDALEEAFSANSDVQSFQLSLIDKWIWKLLSPIVRSSLRNSVPEKQWDRFALCTQDVEEIRRALHQRNSLFGYVYLIDTQLRIRWRAAGIATPEEIETLITLTKRIRSKN